MPKGLPIHSRPVPSWEQSHGAGAHRATLQQKRAEADSLLDAIVKLERREKRRSKGLRRRIARRTRQQKQELRASKSSSYLPRPGRRASVTKLPHFSAASTVTSLKAVRLPAEGAPMRGPAEPAVGECVVVAGFRCWRRA